MTLICRLGLFTSDTDMGYVWNVQEGTRGVLVSQEVIISQIYANH